MQRDSYSTLHVLFVRLFVIYITLTMLIPAVFAIPFVRTFGLLENNGVISSMLSVALLVGVLLLPLLLWFRPLAIVPKTAEQDDAVSVGNIEAAAYRVIGIYFILKGLTGAYRGAVGDYFDWGRVSMASIAQFFCGLALVIGAEGLRKAIINLRGPRIGN